MIIKSRENVFETNSSSMHSFVKTRDEIDKNYLAATINQLNNSSSKTFIINTEDDDLEYGWGYEVLTSFHEKLQYVMVAYNWNEDFINTLMEKLSHKLNIEILDAKYNECGYIDHQSQGGLQVYLYKYNIDIVDFLTDSRFHIIISNDNGGTCVEDSYYSDDGQISVEPNIYVNGQYMTKYTFNEILETSLYRYIKFARGKWKNSEVINDMYYEVEHTDNGYKLYSVNHNIRIELEQMSVEEIFAKDWYFVDED